MSTMHEALLVSGTFFAVMMASQLGVRDYTWHKVVMPLLSVVAVGYFYLRGIPTDAQDLVLYAVGTAVGLAFAVAATVTTAVYRDHAGEVRTRCGVGFVAAWVVAVVVRLGFIWATDNLPSFYSQVGAFMQAHLLVLDSVAPFFVLMALSMVAGRVALVGVRVARLPRRAAALQPEVMDAPASAALAVRAA